MKNKTIKNNPLNTIESQKTAAWAGIEKSVTKSKVPIPSEENVIEAKEWVDNENQK
ncbi:CDIF630_02480 family spore surface protein [Tepidibacter formicigenes]|jgi:hypothetical protein|uniref:DUF3787 domain-containing protein n=1 Tax=Tepidibacter formicigenes DSM 15518 TaxID=1123349 RepID=A0A1M6U9C3_9FIRM|nr:DUF3787 domain-containing protein [Tepidibacter formicigenes]SHK65658.1 protein of unknown function [Tepidibacter formicigenes DSM 15518]